MWWKLGILLDRATWADIEALEPIQQWCAYLLWDRRKWVDFYSMKTQAAAAAGDLDTANSCASKVAELMFPAVEDDRAKFMEESMAGLAKLRGVGFKIQRAG